MTKKKTNKKNTPIVESEGVDAPIIDVDASNGTEVETIDIETNNNIDEVEYSRYCDLKLLTIQGATLKIDKSNFIADFERKTKDLQGLRAKKTVTAFAKNEKIIFIKGIIIPSTIINRLGSIINYYAE